MAFKEIEKEEGKFNLGLATLESINEILNEIQRATIQGLYPDANEGIMQEMKHRLCRYLLLRASPFFYGKKIKVDDKEKDLLTHYKNVFSEIKIKKIESRGMKGEQNGAYSIYDEEVDEKLNSFIEEITTKLQELKGHFDPAKEEGGLFD